MLGQKLIEPRFDLTIIEIGIEPTGLSRTRRLDDDMAVAIAALLTAFAAVEAEAKTTHLKLQRTTAKGKTFNASENWDLNPDCSVRAYRWQSCLRSDQRDDEDRSRYV